MNAIHLLRTMHADTKVRFKVILGADNPARAAEQWQDLQPLLELHEQMEDRCLYAPLFEEMGPGTPLGDWEIQHSADAAIVQQLVQLANELDPGSPEWRMAIGRVVDTLNKHVTDEEGQIFGRIEQVWDTARLEQAGEHMQRMKESATAPRKVAAARRKR
jgi:hemerythrin-like domain-containing protein